MLLPQLCYLLIRETRLGINPEMGQHVRYGLCEGAIHDRNVDKARERARARARVRMVTRRRMAGFLLVIYVCGTLKHLEKCFGANRYTR